MKRKYIEYEGDYVLVYLREGEQKEEYVHTDGVYSFGDLMDKAKKLEAKVFGFHFGKKDKQELPKSITDFPYKSSIRAITFARNMREGWDEDSSRRKPYRVSSSVA